VHLLEFKSADHNVAAELGRIVLIRSVDSLNQSEGTGQAELVLSLTKDRDSLGIRPLAESLSHRQFLRQRQSSVRGRVAHCSSGSDRDVTVWRR
jgi:hypothetical protein